jgi:esterase/lipase superfamily enzyme
MGVAIYGNYGAPILAFPTSCGDEWEMEGQGMIRTLSPYLEQGRIRIFCINSVNSDSFQNKGAHPFHRSWMQAQYDAYVANEVFRSSTPSAKRRESGLPRWAHRSVPITRPTLSSSIPIM